MNNSSHSQDGFSSRLGVLAATLGSAVGLGNIWKFPYLVGANGGAGFLLLYILAVALVGLPVMIAELSLGRQTRADAVTAFQKMAPGKPWWLIGAMGIVAAIVIMGFYTEVAGWVLAYAFKAAAGTLTSSDPHANHQIFLSLVTDPVASLGWQWLILALVTVVIISGVSKGIEAVTKRLMPLLFVLLIVIGIRSLMLGSAAEGLAFLFKPDWSHISAGVFITALGLAFFKLSIGMGTMLTYGSYFRADQNIPGTALRVMLADLSVSLLAGIARLAEEPKGEPLRRVLDRTYLCGTPSQEAAAEVLGLPFSTYRRYLARATTRLVDLLWAVEVGTEVGID